MMTTKMTYASAIAYVLNNCDVPTDVFEKLENLSAQFEKRADAPHKPTKAQKENEVLKTAILDGMEFGKQYTVSEMVTGIPACDGLTANKVSALMKQLKDSGLVVRTEVKRKAYFSKVDALND